MEIVAMGTKVVLATLVSRDVDPEVTRYAGKRFSRAAGAWNWWRQARSDPRHVVLAIRTYDDGLIGDVELVDINWARREAELRIRIGDPRFWSRGYGRDAVNAAVDYAARLGLRRIFLRVDTRNARAIRCFLGAGFHKRARLVAGRRRAEGLADMYLMERTLVPEAGRGDRQPGPVSGRCGTGALCDPAHRGDCSP